ncbi:MAG: hypothetical protein V4488_20385 [Pseudomonadota bacterium]
MKEFIPSKRRHVSVAPALKERGGKNENLWFFESPKNDIRFVAKGDLDFVSFVLLEGDTSVSSYNPYPGPMTFESSGTPQKIEVDASVHFRDGRTEFWQFRREEPKTRNQGITNSQFRVITDKEFRSKEILFDNWSVLCAAITRARNYPVIREAQVLHSELKERQQVTYGALLDIQGVEPALMLSIVAKSLQLGDLQTDLANTLFNSSSVLRRSSTCRG